jgi:uncharacterized protein (TIGR00251 family)
VAVVRIAVRVTPRASRDSVDGWVGEELAVHVCAPPAEGDANAAVCELVGNAIGVPKSSVRVVRGMASRRKMLEVTGVDAVEAMRRLGRT